MINPENAKDVSIKLLHSPISVDRLDYLMRDSDATKVGFGSVDYSRVLESLTLQDDIYIVDHMGIRVVENVVLAANLMYDVVYFNEKVRAIEGMIIKALKLLFDKHLNNIC